ncbi:succinate dehydrogenase, cytochrome b556 subunit [Amantichitinum ursilacus]|uniref:Succinate dehydrogenase cytochrome b556 subunit n=1 Tax=Amantichitinum ursilacus TaxID=857265 RepID=A0A0N0XKJ8_9NEIS|nr:succinate dehydrogenase, cytochrome b556 subunit [Amantichitinum ursilacus]KPC52897.1 Succinate dehydrogenase cytochrome b556 subunit [Amantichitinum ursilacus]
MSATRPKHLAIWQIRMPLPAIVSILHRASGALLFAAVPFMLYALQGTLSSADRFEAFRACIAHPLVKLALLAVLWAFLHHACAGIRFLLMDIHKGVELPKARASAYAVLGVSIVLTIVTGGLTW